MSGNAVVIDGTSGTNAPVNLQTFYANNYKKLGATLPSSGAGVTASQTAGCCATLDSANCLLAVVNTGGD